MKRLAIIAIITTLTWGCVTRLDSGDGHKARYLVIGLGVVWVNDSVPEAATVSGVKSLGITVSDRPGMKLAVGYTDSYAVTVPDGQAKDPSALVFRIYTDLVLCIEHLCRIIDDHIRGNDQPQSL